MPRRRRPPRPGVLADLSPTRILSQIVVLQLAYYACAAILIIFTALVAGKEVSTDLLFSWRSLRGDTTVGWTLGLVWVLNSLVCAIFILLLIARSKLVLDFALTVHFIHLIVTSLYSHSLPTNLFWWALQIFSAALMTSLGMWACQWRELRPITFGGKGAGSNGTQQGNNVVGDDGVGHSRGTGRARGRDGAGEYEMVAMNDRNGNV
ncbi:hypothetical protein CC78DRAFT_456913 [Lojkania enalia]|uniref:Integral membrane protein S linking to the trans Golgi network-domain-containing protein n=1 Tax=Lojkania enalia TaxID=147567 RepID=A0A9P4N6M7_9PLEO|nr:hypothetical protein CC78DRAFT_456913 [Didymosphaeria enalia]